MMDLLHMIWISIQFVVYIIMWISVVCFLLKSFWNFGVPYAMIREAKTRPKEQHGWSLFILLDFALLLVALITSTILGQEGYLNPWRIAGYGVSAIGASYVNLFVVVFTAGCLGLLPKQTHEGRFHR